MKTCRVQGLKFIDNFSLQTRSILQRSILYWFFKKTSSFRVRSVKSKQKERCHATSSKSLDSTANRPLSGSADLPDTVASLELHSSAASSSAFCVASAQNPLYCNVSDVLVSLKQSEGRALPKMPRQSQALGVSSVATLATTLWRRWRTLSPTPESCQRCFQVWCLINLSKSITVILTNTLPTETTRIVTPSSWLSCFWPCLQALLS
jgi:hypothetical protein